MTHGVTHGRLGFACNWDPDPQRTWSGTAWSLWQALQRQADCPDVGVHLPGPARRALQLVTRRRRNGQWVSTWEHTAAWQSILADRVQRSARAAGCDVVLEIQDIAVLDRPFYIYQDLSYDVLLAERTRDENGVGQYFRTLDDRTIEHRRARQHQVYRQAAGVIAMSRWLADSLVRDSGLSRDKVHVAYPGASSLEGVVSLGDPPPRPAPRRRLLFLGTSFLVKGGDVLLEAFARIRQRDRSITLTLAGPSTWPAAGPVPDGVDFLGRVPRSAVPALFDRHDLLVMPSRLEGFGIVFVEAMARGLPCIGRRAFAMPELIEDGVTGALVDSDDPVELASAIMATLENQAIYDEVARRADDVAARFTWAGTARTILDVIERHRGDS